MKYIVMLIALCSFVLGTQVVASHTRKARYKKTARAGGFSNHYGCACGH